MYRTVYPVAMTDSSNTLELQVDGMHCASCVANVQTALEGLPGAMNVRVDLHQALASLEGPVEAATAIAQGVSRP